MSITSTSRLTTAMIGALAVATVLASASSPKFYDDDPLWIAPDTQDASRIQPTEVSLFVDLTYNIIEGSSVVNPRRAQNINTVDEVPDSSWFTNRIGHRSLTPEDVATGPDTSAGPGSGTWTIVSSKSDGVTPGFTIKDAAGQRWFLKFDPRGYRAMATGTEVAVTKLMWALGYNVPENHIAYMRRDQLVVGDGAKFTAPGGKPRAMQAGDIDDLLERASREPDGGYRVVASRALPGKPIGRVRFYSTRPDDPNDVVAHEDRRELRGYGVFAAWLNHVDAKAINSLDTLVTENGRSFVRHHLIDFGSSLGSGGIGPAEYSAGDGYLVQPREIGKLMVGFGLYAPKWRTTPFYEARAIGRLPEHNTDFNPEQWRPRVPNQAFLHARADDKFWAARKLVALSTPILRSAVKTGDFGDPAAEDFLVRALAERRDAIARVYLTAVNPIVDPVLDGDCITFGNAAVDGDFARIPDGYRAVWSTFDNAIGIARRIAETSSMTTTIEAPKGLSRGEGTFVKVELSAIGGMYPSWGVPVTAYFRIQSGSWRLVGFERMPEGK